jgi:histidyl-tRNA synthetase
MAHVDALGGAGWVDLDLSIVRGLAYYTGIVFELFDAKGELRAVCGGGRYDSLLKALGGVDLPALGFGMGDVVLGELLKARGLVPVVSGSRADLFVVGGDGALEHPIADALTLTHRLREAGFSVDYALNAERYVAQSTRNQVDAAKKSGARAALYFSPGATVVVQGLHGRMMEAPKGEFAAAPLLAGDSTALAAFKDWFDRVIPQRSMD